MRKNLLLLAGLIVAVFGIAAVACSDDDDAGNGGNVSTATIEVDGQTIAGVGIAITSPEDGSTVTNPVTVAIEVVGGVAVEAAADAQSGAVHYFGSVDGAQVNLATNTVVARGEENAGIYQWSAGSIELDLEPGEHTLIVGLANNDDAVISDQVQASVTFTVEAEGD